MDEIKFSQPGGEGQQNEGGQAAKPNSKRKSGKNWLLFLVIAVIVVGLGYTYKDKLFTGGSGAEVIGKASEYQSVFLTNGQVYFGKMSNPTSEYATLKDVFYLQVIQPPLQGPDQGEGGSVAQSQPQISLVKLGQELHGPVDEMQINRDHIIFFEDLKEDSKVVQAIKAFKESQAAN